MLKTTAIVASVLALSASAAWAGDWLSSGANDAPGGANGAARMRAVGEGTPNVAHTVDGRTSSSSMLMHDIKRQNAGQALTSDGPSGVYIIDEYGFHYNSRGERVP